MSISNTSKSMKVLSLKERFFPCGEKSFAQCFQTGLHYTFCMKAKHVHPYHPQQNAPMRHDEKNFNGIRKGAQKNSDMFAQRDKNDSNKIFHQIRKRQTFTRFYVKSKRLKLPKCACAKFVENLM